MSAPRDWNDRDAWLLVALAQAGGGRLCNFFFRADAINKDVPTLAELDGALRRFIGAGLVEQTDNGFSLTRAGRRMYRSARARSVYDHIDGVRRNLRSSGPPKELPSWHLDSAEYESELEAYHQEFQRILKSLDDGIWGWFRTLFRWGNAK